MLARKFPSAKKGTRKVEGWNQVPARFGMPAVACRELAFTTTVVGIFIGGLCFVLYTVRQRRYEQDMNDLECVVKKKSTPHA